MSKNKLNQFLLEFAWQIGPPLTYGVLMLRFFPYWRDIWISFDEGYNLMKAMMVVKGFTLYSQIWSDQPPLLTYLLAWMYRLNGYSIYSSRLLILAFSCVMVWSIVQFLRLAWGNMPALLAVIILFLVPYFPTLSAAVMVGQPSLAMASVSLLFLAVWHRRRQQIFLALSALVFCLSILTKLFTGSLALVFVVGLVASEYFGAEKDEVSSQRTTSPDNLLPAGCLAHSTSCAGRDGAGLSTSALVDALPAGVDAILFCGTFGVKTSLVSPPIVDHHPGCHVSRRSFR